MNEMIAKRNELLAQKVIKGLQSRRMNGYYAATKEEALRLALSLIPEGSSVGMGGGMSVAEIGLKDALIKGNYRFIDRDTMDRREAYLKMYDCDFFLAGTNAISDDGILVNIDGNGNRISAIAYGPRKVLFFAGMNKVCPDVESAIQRARNVAAPINAQRFDRTIPCRKLGSCADCKSPDSICCQMLITRFGWEPDRIHVILIGESVGY